MIGPAIRSEGSDMRIKDVRHNRILRACSRIDNHQPTRRSTCSMIASVVLVRLARFW